MNCDHCPDNLEDSNEIHETNLGFCLCITCYNHRPTDRYEEKNAEAEKFIKKTLCDSLSSIGLDYE